jgi:erythromycin esterase
MGSVFTSNEKKFATYILGFTSSEGTAGRLFSRVYTIEKPRGQSFENWVSQGFPYAFVDFMNYNKDHPEGAPLFYMSGASLGNNRYHSNYLAEWNRIFDGVFYIRKMYPCER